MTNMERQEKSKSMAFNQAGHINDLITVFRRQEATA